MKARPILKQVYSVVTTALAIAATAPLSAAWAGGPTQAAPNPTFQKLDANRDGYVSRDEAAKLRDLVKGFDAADEDHDGRLSPAEFVKAQAEYDRARAAVYIDDGLITTKVKAALVKDPDVKAFDVSVETSHGIVLLSGFVDSEKQARRAKEIAALVEGVKSVRSNLVVKS